MLERFSTILLDMNQTFMFGADRFGPNEDYSIVYRQLGGQIESKRVNYLVQAAFDYLSIRYPDPHYHEAFPSVRDALVAVAGPDRLSEQALEHLVKTFTHHELGVIPPEYAAAIHKLSQRFRLGLVVDIWAPSPVWIEAATQCGVLPVCEAAFFSSDYGIVKPSPRAFLQVLEEMQVDPQDAVMVGDSVRRDLGGAIAAGIDCILVDGATHPNALGAVENLLALVN